eukprot:m.80217 g.80217  ORF g.80217 m.80217 type:complete len:59 (-) comp25294_c2_seq3:30-206(-)
MCPFSESVVFSNPKKHQNNATHQQSVNFFDLCFRCMTTLPPNEDLVFLANITHPYSPQ